MTTDKIIVFPPGDSYMGGYHYLSPKCLEKGNIVVTEDLVTGNKIYYLNGKQYSGSFPTLTELGRACTFKRSLVETYKKFLEIKYNEEPLHKFFDKEPLMEYVEEGFEGVNIYEGNGIFIVEKNNVYLSHTKHFWRPIFRDKINLRKIELPNYLPDSKILLEHASILNNFWENAKSSSIYHINKTTIADNFGYYKLFDNLYLVENEECNFVPLNIAIKVDLKDKNPKLIEKLKRKFLKVIAILFD